MSYRTIKQPLEAKMAGLEETISTQSGDYQRHVVANLVTPKRYEQRNSRVAQPL